MPTQPRIERPDAIRLRLRVVRIGSAITGLLALSYLVILVFGSDASPVPGHLLLGLSAAALTVAGLIVAGTLGGHEARRSEIERQRVEVADLTRQLRRSVAELRAVTEITDLLHSTLEVESVEPALLDILERVSHSPAASMYVINKANQETVFSASRADATQSPLAFSAHSRAAAPAGSSSDGAIACIDLVDHDQTLVVFCAETAAIEALSGDDRVVLQAMASQLVVAVENSRLYRLTKHLAITDELTDLYNYRYLQQRLDEEIGRADRYHKRLALLMIDLDDFKRVNDSHGHLVGDIVLAEVGQVLKGVVREVDVVARYGGEEFTVILPETDAAGALFVAEKIREAIGGHRFADAEGSRTIHLTASVGLTSYPVHASDKESLLRTADHAVYQAKATGKDRVCSAPPRLRSLASDADDREEAHE